VKFLDFLTGNQVTRPEAMGDQVNPSLRIPGVQVSIPFTRITGSTLPPPVRGLGTTTGGLFSLSPIMSPLGSPLKLSPFSLGLKPFSIKTKKKGDDYGIITGLIPSGQVSQDKIQATLKWKSDIEYAAQQHGVPWELLAAIVAVESGGNPNAVSPAGAVGLAQVMPQYHAQRAAKYGGDLSDPRVNLLVAAEILAENYKRYGSWDKAIAAYFGAIDAYGNITDAKDAIGTSGTQYVKLVKGYWDVFSGKKGNLWSITGGKQYPLTQEFGATEFARTSGYYQGGQHPGIDIGVPMGTAIYAPVSGVIEVAGNYGGYGMAVGIRTQDGHFILLGHLSEVSVRPGQTVTPGTLVGKSGNTGVSTGPHLHVEVRDPGGKSIDPRLYLG